jgi:hypothetical protein
MKLLRLHPPLMITAAAMLVLLIPTAAGLFIDDRTLLGVPVWLKPLKFEISVAIYAATFAWIISLLSRGKRAAHLLGTVAAAALLLEMVIIIGQAARGVRSHFNNTTAFDGWMFRVMGLTIVLVWVATLWVGILALIQRVADRPSTLAVRFGVLTAAIGMAVGFLMVVPSKSQMAALNQGERVNFQGAHAVGVDDGGPGLPLLNWSTEAGDLRAGHFIGMHALQALPLLALLLAFASRRFAGLRDETLRARLISVAGFGYAGLTVLVTWQALRGQSIVHPDALTLGVAAALAATVALGAIWALTNRPAVKEALA